MRLNHYLVCPNLEHMEGAVQSAVATQRANAVGRQWVDDSGERDCPTILMKL